MASCIYYRSRIVSDKGFVLQSRVSGSGGGGDACVCRVARAASCLGPLLCVSSNWQSLGGRKTRIILQISSVFK